MEEEAYYDQVKERKVIVPEIIEIEEEENDDYKGVNSGNNDKNTTNNKDVYVCVGKDDVEVLKWVLAHAVVPGNRVNLIHIYPPISSISTPVGRLWVGQLSPEQAKIYAIEEHNKRKNLLHKYIRLCVDNEVNVDTILIESTDTSKAILDLIPVLNMTSLVMGTTHPRSSRRLIKGSNKGTLVLKNAPDYCEVTLVYKGKKLVDNRGKMHHHISSSFLASDGKQAKVTRQNFERNYMECTCFPVRF
ncbi:hypothetical protein BVRB_5g118050 [Beta vulgaris subsp. vulgaris]|nr:hypothetical protein BVRB_5g118050 [Beta vulgaris subsp. vulgaris]